MFKVKLQIPEQAFASFEEAPDAERSDFLLNAAMKKLNDMLMRRVMMELQSKAKANAPVKTGFLRDHIGTQHKGDNWELVASAHYASFQEFGTGIYRKENPGFIIPKKAKYLVSKNKQGKLIFTKKVKGFPGRFYMTRALNEMDDAFEKAWEQL